MQDKFSGLTQVKLKTYLEYTPDTGLFVWKIKLSNSIGKGSVAGSEDAYGYIQIELLGFAYKAHRLAWFYMTGEWPKDQLDHENRVRNDNRWNNLREASQTQNSQNQSTSYNTTSGLKGAYKWLVSVNDFIRVRG